MKSAKVTTKEAGHILDNEYSRSYGYRARAVWKRRKRKKNANVRTG